jgi:WD40 repeat protein
MGGTERARHGAFISYARQDGEAFARSLQARLAADAPDIPAWLDRLELEGGIGWWKQVEQQLDRAEFLILIMTPAAMRSENTRREWRSARQRGVCVYPVKGVRDPALDYASLPTWMRKTHFYDPDVEWEKLIAHLRRGCDIARVPFMAPPLPGGFIERPRETEELITLLRAGETASPAAITTALRGAGGFGKTTLAAAVCHDDRVTEVFDDGVLWATLGQTPNLLNEVMKLYAALTGDRPSFVDLEDAQRELELRIENKNCLIVIDDVWQAAHLKPFLRGGKGCARLITTRLFDVAADATRVDVDQMELGEATQLLLGRADVQTDDPEPFARLAARLGGWPLPLKLAGSAIRQRILRGDSVAKALDYATRALDKRGITAFDRAEATDRAEAVTHTVGASLDLLTPAEQRKCCELTIFPEDSATPLPVAAALWQLDDLDSEDLARKLDDLALLDFDLRSGMLRMHDVLRSFLATRVEDAPALHGRLVDAWGDPYALTEPYAWRRYTYHLRGAERQAEGHRLLLDPRWYHARLRAGDMHGLLTDFDPLAGDAVLDLVCDALRLSAPCIAADRRQLDSQLLGRLLERDEPEIVALRNRIHQGRDGAWLRPLHPVLDAPGGMLFMTLVGHEGEITAMAMTADRRFLLSASNDGTVRVWDQQQGGLQQVFHHRMLGARAVSVTRDAALAVSGGADGMLYVWDVATAERAPSFRGVRGPAFSSVAVSGDGRLAVSGSREHVVKVWDLASRTGVRSLSGHRDRVTSVAISADGSRAVSGSEDTSVRVWSVTTDTLERALYGHKGAVNAVAISPDGRWALSGSSDRTVKLWEVDTGVCQRTLDGHASSVTSVALAATGWRAVSGSSDQTTRLWDLQTGAMLATLDGHSDAVTAVAIDASGLHAASGSTDRSVKLWRLDDLRPGPSRVAHAGAVVALAFSEDGRLCASGGSDGRVVVRDTETWRIVGASNRHTAPVRSLAFTIDGACVLSSGIDQSYWLWTIEDDSTVWIPVRHTAPVSYCALSARARYLVTACGDRFVYVWDVPSGALVERYGTRRLFDHLITPVPRRRLLPESDENLDRYLSGEAVYDVGLVRVNATGSHAVLSATVRLAGTARQRAEPVPSEVHEGACLLVLDLATSQVQSLTTGQSEPVSAFALDDDARRMLWAKTDNTIELWDLERAARLGILRGHSGTVNGVAFSQDGQCVMSCSRDRTVRAWDTSTGEPIAAYTADSALRSIALSPRDEVVAVGDVAGRVHLLRLEGPRSSSSVQPNPVSEHGRIATCATQREHNVPADRRP